MERFITKKREGISSLFFCFSLFFVIYPVLLQIGDSSLGQVKPASLQDMPLREMSFFQHLFFIAKVVIYASIEEFLYRVYFPYSLKGYLYLAFKKIKKTKLDLIARFSSCILFAASHLYLGLFNVVFAFFASIVLLWMYEKIKRQSNILAFFAVSAFHASFNIASLYIMLSIMM